MVEVNKFNVNKINDFLNQKYKNKVSEIKTIFQIYMN